MTLKRLMISILVLSLLLGGGIAWFWQYAYTPLGRARTIFCELHDDDKGFRASLLRLNIIRSEVGSGDQGEGVAVMEIRAKKRLSELGAEVRPAVMEKLDVRNESVRCITVWACGKYRIPESFSRLSDLFGDPNVSDGIRGECVRALCQIDYDRATPLLEVALKDNGEYARVQAAIALARSHDGRVSQILLDYLATNYASLDEQVEIALVLGTLGDRRAIPALRKLQDSGLTKEVRDAAMQGLSELMQEAGCTKPATAGGK